MLLEPENRTATVGKKLFVTQVPYVAKGRRLGRKELA